MSSTTDLKTPNSPRNVDKLAAGLLRRIAAISYDVVILIGPLAIYGFALAFITSRVGASPVTALGPAGLLIIPGAYCCWSWTHGGQTVGMKAWKIYVCGQSGEPVNWRRATIRYGSAWISFAAIGLGFAWSVFSKNQRTWHDTLSKTEILRINAPESTPKSPPA